MPVPSTKQPGADGDSPHKATGRAIFTNQSSSERVAACSRKILLGRIKEVEC